MKKIKRIVLVDDDEQVNFLHKIIIDRAKCADEVVVFDNAGEALKYILDGPNDDYPLVLLDINMPAMSGWDFVDHFENGARKAIVVMLTSSINPNDEKRARAIDSVKGFYSKPLSESMLQKIIDTNY